MSPLEKKFDNFMKGFYGTLDVSVDYTTKGIYDPAAVSLELRERAFRGAGYVHRSGRRRGPTATSAGSG